MTNSLNYQLINPIAGMTIDSNGLITWDNPILGNHSVAIKVTDNAGNSVGQGYKLTARSHQAPTINVNPITQVTIGNTYRYDIIATDADKEPLTYTLNPEAILSICA
jgi:large repetitive protein